MRIIVVGAFEYEMYEEAFCRGLESNSADVMRFRFAISKESLFSKLQIKASIRQMRNDKLCYDLIKKIIAFRPDAILFWLPYNIHKKDIYIIRSVYKGIIVSYIHDEPFNFRGRFDLRRSLFWRAGRNTFSSYDLVLFAKELTFNDAISAGVKSLGILPQFYVEGIHNLNPNMLNMVMMRHVTFAGHFESDGRDETLLAVAQAGYPVRIYGGRGWRSSKLWSELKFHPLISFHEPVYGKEYSKLLNTSVCCFTFLSKLNRDVYTTRSFEIPACGGAQISERSKELAQIFLDGEEILFFDTPEEAVAMVGKVWDSDNFRYDLCVSGSRAVKTGNHSNIGRSRLFLEFIDDIIYKDAEQSQTEARNGCHIYYNFKDWMSSL